MPNDSPNSGNTSKTRTSLDQLFSALGHAPRRRVLYELADRVRNEDEPGHLVIDESTLALSEYELYHLHLPKLDDAEFVDWDLESGRVSPGDRFEDVEPLLSLLRDHPERLPEPLP